MNTLATPINTNQNSTNLIKKNDKNSEKSSDDFITILFNEIKNDTKSVLKLKPKISLKNDDKTLSIDKLLLGDILNIISLLRNEANEKKFPKFSDKLDKILNSVSAKNDFKNVKNINDLLKLSKKYTLGLKDIELTKVEIKTLKKEFPKLDIEKFFDIKKNNTESIINQKNKTMAFKKIPNKTTVKKKNLQKNPLENYLKTMNTEVKTAQKEANEAIHVESNITKNTQKEKRKLKTTTLNEIKKEKLQTSQNFQDSLLQKIKSQKQTDSGSLSQLQNHKNTPDKKITKSENIEQKHEFKTPTLIQDNKTVKHTEAKSSLNHFSTDLKEKIESYRPPITRLKMALNPKNLGEVEVTLIHRGNNLHINITSNTNTMALFNQNQSEFKNSLVNMGFTNLEMNFSDQNKNKQKNQNGSKNSNSLKELQTREDSDNSIELIMPLYI